MYQKSDQRINENNDIMKNKGTDEDDDPEDQ